MSNVNSSGTTSGKHRTNKMPSINNENESDGDGDMSDNESNSSRDAKGDSSEADEHDSDSSELDEHECDRRTQTYVKFISKKSH